MPEEVQPRRASRLGTARALVLLAGGLQLAVTALATFLLLVFGPAVLHRPASSGPLVLAAAALVTVTVLDIALATGLALRARSTGRVLGAGCTTLLAGAVLGLGLSVLLATR